MSVAMILEILLAVFGPFLSELIKPWLERLFKRAAADLYGPETSITINAVQGAEAIVERALEMTPYRYIGRRNLLRLLVWQAKAAVTAKKLTKPNIEEVKKLVALAA